MHILWSSIKPQWQTEISLQHHARLSSIHLSVCLYFFLQLLMQQPGQKQSYLCDNPPPPPLGRLMHLLVLCITPSPLPRPQPLFLFQSFTKKLLFFLYFFLLTSVPASHGLENHVVSTVAVAWEKKREVCVKAHFWEVRDQPHPPLIYPSLLVRPRCCLWALFHCS